MCRWCTNPDGHRADMLASVPHMQSIHKLFGSRVRQLREQEQLGAADVAALVGCDVSHYYAIERGTHPPSFALIVAIAKTFKVDEADLFTWPGSGIRHDLREQIRLAPPQALGPLKTTLGHPIAPSSSTPPTSTPAARGGAGASEPAAGGRGTTGRPPTPRSRRPPRR